MREMPFVLTRQLPSQTNKASSVTGVVPDTLPANFPFLYTEKSPLARMPERPAKALVLPAIRTKAIIPVVSNESFFIYYLLCLLSDGLPILMCCITLFL